MSFEVKVGNVKIGGGNAVSVQSMCNTHTSDVSATINQINAAAMLGADIMRVSVRDENDAAAIKEIKKHITVPLVADVHFDYRLAIKAVENGADKIRINPGNIGSDENIEKVAVCLKRNNVPCRVGSNSGSVEKKFAEKYGNNEIALAESALAKAAVLEKFGVTDIVLSAKSSSLKTTVGAYEYLHKKCDYPLHVGVTEAGTLKSGLIKGSAGIGALLLQGIGDTIRYSLASPPEEEVVAGVKLLRSLGLGKDGAEVIACPTCGRTEYDSIGLAERVEKMVADIKKPLKIAVMGCIVNGPGEARGCDIGIAGNGKRCVLFKKGEIIANIAVEDAEKLFIEEIKKLAAETPDNNAATADKPVADGE